ncbi:hypothetical protein GG851_23600 [Bordetella petrii]|nr:hypothetical protein [Bordetella petrii]
MVNDGRVGALSLQAGAIRLDDARLAATQSLRLQGPLVQAGAGRSELRAPYILMNGLAAGQAGGEPAGTLAMTARQAIEVTQGYVRGFARTELRTGDLRFAAVDEARNDGLSALLQADGTLDIAAAQVYPGTAVRARIAAADAIIVRGNGNAGAPLSAGGSLTLAAPRIEHNGVLRAPFGEIVLEAGERLALGRGSLTSVSGAGLIVPYGTLSNGEYWLDPANPENINLDDPDDSSTTLSHRYLSALPEKRVALRAPDVALAGGAVVDVSGGGDVYAWEHVPGPGGSHDVLSLPGMYAVLPGYRGLSPQAGAESGGRVWLAGGGGLEGGWHTLLPARYALLPGAYAVQATGNTWQFDAPGQGGAVALRDGAFLMRGRSGDRYGGSSQPVNSAWRVMAGGQVRRHSEYNEALGNAFFSSEAFKLSQYRQSGLDVITPRLARDGGAVVFEATDSLLLDGRLASQPDAGGRGGLVDIAARKIAIIGAGRDADGLRADGYLIVDAAGLSGFGAGSLLVGGARTGTALGLALDISASDVLLRNDADSALTSPEVILAATERVDVDDGSVLRSRGDFAGTASDLVMTPQEAAVWDDNGTGNDPSDDFISTPARDWGALVRVSSGPAVQVLREGVDTSRGRMRIGAGALLDGAGALLVDATDTTAMAAGARLSGAAMSVSSGRIGIGGGQGLVLDEAAVAQLSRTQVLTLRSYGSLDFHRSLDLGAAGLASVVLDATALQGHGAKDVRVTAERLVLQNTGAAADTDGGGRGRLTLQAGELVLGEGSKRIAGFGSVTLAAAQHILGQGSGRLDAGQAALTLAAPVLSGMDGASQDLRTEGRLALRQAGAAPDEAALLAYGQGSLGVRLQLSGQGVDLAMPVLALGGSISVDAGTGNLHMGPQGRLMAGGLALPFYDVTEYADAGSVSLATRGGTVDLRAGSVVDVAAHPGGGQGGSLSLSATEGGRVRLDGRLLAVGGEAGRGGDFALDIDRLDDFGALAATLNQAGFGGARRFQIREGDVVLAGATRVESLEVVADRGAVTVAGDARIDARARYGGSIRLVGGQGLAMRDGARLLAGATDTADGLGSGRIVLEAAGGRIDLAGGVLDVAGGEGGKVRVRARRNAANDGVAVTALNARVVGARSAVLEGVRRYDAGAAGTVESVRDLAVAEANAFASETGLLAALGGRAGAYALAAGIEIASDADLTLDSDWNLAETFGAAHREGTLTLLAGGDLRIAGHLSDGFDAASRTAAGGQAARLLDAPSWDLRLVSGADLGSADALALQTPGALADGRGTIRLGTADSSPDAGDGAGRLVRTGTGDLTVRAGRDLVLAHKDSAFYTAGRRAADPTLGGLFDTASVDAQYGEAGGHVAVLAQGDVRAPTEPGARSEQILTEWLFRQGRVGGPEDAPSGYFDPYEIDRKYSGGGYVYEFSDRGQQPSWWVNYATFEQGLGALGGGNVSLQAGGDLVNLVVALPSHMRLAGGRSAADAAPAAHQRNGGQMRVRADGAIRAGQYYVGRGHGDLRASETGGGYRLQTAIGGVDYAFDIAPVLALGDATLALRTAGDLQLQTVVDPMLIRRAFVDAADQALKSSYRHDSAMSSYTGRSAVSLVSLGGSLRLINQSRYVTADTYGIPGMPFSTDRVGMYPARLKAAALGGSMYLESELAMMPGDRTDLRLLAAGDLAFVLPSAPYRGGRRGSIVMTLSTMAGGPRIAAPARRSFLYTHGAGEWTQFVYNNYGGRFATNRIEDNPDVLPMQVHDFEPSRIYARDGSITDMNLTMSESTHVRAGTDIRNFDLKLRNLRASDTTLLQAGNDILAMQEIRRRVPSMASIQGPGQLLLSAGRDIQAAELELSSNGNVNWNAEIEGPWVIDGEVQRFAALPGQGAGITLMAGIGQAPDYASFERAYLDPAGVGAMPGHLTTRTAGGEMLPLYLADAVERRDGQDKLVRRGLVSYMQQMTGQELSPLQAWEQYQSLPLAARQHFLRQVFMYELRDAGRDQNAPDVRGQPANGGYERGYRAIETLFPGGGWRGDVAATNLSVRTNRGGDINVFTPGGGLQVAALGAPAPDGYGLVTLAPPGQVNVFADQDIVVNRSRILSFVSKTDSLGSDQVLWSTLGDIDAGRGAKTVRVAQPPEITADDDGEVTVQENLDMSGSGIGTVGEGDVDLIAPKGTVNAGDAGIRVAGNFNVAALQVLNAANIQVQGESKGLPPMVAVNIGALTSASSAASAAASAAEETVSRARNEARQNQPSIFTVRILGFGGAGAGGGRAAPGGSAGSGPPADAREVGYRPDGMVQVLGDGELAGRQLSRLTGEERGRLGL